MNIIVIIQARLSSERLPEKVLKELEGIPMIKRIVERANQAKTVDRVVVATSKEQSDDKMYDYCRSENISVFRGELDNVLKRYYDCAGQNQAEMIVRLTGDNALVDAHIIDRAAELFLNEGNLDYLHYCKELPLGMAVEVFSYKALERAYLQAENPECKEHVTLYMYKNESKFKCLFYSEPATEDCSGLRWTMDTEEDYELIKRIYQYFGQKQFHYEDVLEAYMQNPEWKRINRSIRHKTVKYEGEQR